LEFRTRRRGPSAGDGVGSAHHRAAPLRNRKQPRASMRAYVDTPLRNIARSPPGRSRFGYAHHRQRPYRGRVSPRIINSRVGRRSWANARNGNIERMVSRQDGVQDGRAIQQARHPYPSGLRQGGGPTGRQSLSPPPGLEAAVHAFDPRAHAHGLFSAARLGGLGHSG
jgi:hypothetical protein